MIKNIIVNRGYRLVILTTLAIILIGLWMLTNARQPVQAADSTIQSAFVCTPVQVGVFNNSGPGRVHVKCLETYNDSGSIIYYWAYSASDSAAAGRYQSLFSTAQVTGSTVTVYFTPGDTSGNAWGCGSTDCRRIVGATTP